jgi:hypothetical protein
MELIAVVGLAYPFENGLPVSWVISSEFLIQPYDSLGFFDQDWGCAGIGCDV